MADVFIDTSFVLALVNRNDQYHMDEVLQELPDLDEDDLRGCMVYGTQKLGGKA